MVAEVQVEEITGAFGSETFTLKDDTEVNNSRYYTADNHSATATTNPVPIPNEVVGGVSGSYWKTHCLNVTGAPSVRIENIRFYVGWDTHPSSQWLLCAGNTEGDHVIGVSSASDADCRILTQGFPSSSYDQATGTESVCGDFISGAGSVNHTYYNGCTNGHIKSTALFSTQTNALMVYSGTKTRNGSSNCVGRSWAVCTQVLVASGATQGEKDPVTATWVYDEV